MKKLFILLFAIQLFSLNSCSKSEYMDSATIIGLDTEKCDCCGGWIIDIEGFKLKFDKLPEESDIVLLNANFPIDVELNWKYTKELKCSKTKIDIIDIKKK